MDPTLEPWPALPLAAWSETYATLHRYLQIIGKLKLQLAPMTNHWWQVALGVTPRGLTTGTMPHGDGAISVGVDLLSDELVVDTSDGRREVLPLGPQPVADFYAAFVELLRRVGVEARIWDVPVEIPNDTLRFHDDQRHHAYDRAYVRRFARVLVQAQLALDAFRARFRGKCSPVHFFWGSFDLAVTRFSGRPAPPRLGADRVTQEAYGEEVSSVGFWPGTPGVCDAAFYSYAAPEPPGFRTHPVRPAAARYEPQLSEFILPYDALRTAPHPQHAVLEFCQSTYEAAAELGHWDRERFETWPARAGTAQTPTQLEQEAAE